MYFIKDCQLYTITSQTDNFIVAKRYNGQYLETFKKGETGTIYYKANEVIPDTLIERSVFDGKSELDGKEYRGKRS